MSVFVTGVAWGFALSKFLTHPVTVQHLTSIQIPNPTL